MKITMEGKYQTRGGLLPSAPVRLLCLDGPRNAYPVWGIVDRKGEREICEWTASGLWLCGGPEGEHDLVPTPTKHEGFVIVSIGPLASLLTVVVYRYRQDAEARRSGAIYPETWKVISIAWEI